MNLSMKDIKRSVILYSFLVLPLLWYLIFCYVPMGGIIVAFKKYSIYKGMLNSPWNPNGIFGHFRDYLTDPYFWKVFRNTFLLGAINLIVTFPATIFLAVVFNELREGPFKKLSQTISYLPYFISTVAIVNIIIVILTPSTGIVNQIMKGMGMQPVDFIQENSWFIPVYVFINLWKNLGWGTIIYVAAMTNINPELYEAADVEGAGRMVKIFSITLPSILPTIVITLILNMPGILGADFETVLLLQQPATLDVSDTIPTYIYRRAFQPAGFGTPKLDYAAAIGLFFSVLSTLVVVVTNKMARKLSEISLW